MRPESTCRYVSSSSFYLGTRSCNLQLYAEHDWRENSGFAHAKLSAVQ